ncbi:MAG: hypothetical protein WCG93_10355 [Paludibacter sp.]
MKKNIITTALFMAMSIAMLSLFSSCNSSGSKTKNSLFTSEKVDKNLSSNGEMFGGNLSNFKGQASSGASASTGINMPGSLSAPSASIAQADVENVPQHAVSRSSADGASNYNRNQSQSFKSSNVASINNQQNTTVVDINSSLKTNTPSVAKTTTKGKAIADKANSGSQKVKPNGPLSSLPVGNGVWILLIFASMYGARKKLVA